jgi:hypothetical protein
LLSIPPLVLENDKKKFELPPLQLTNISTDLEISQLQKPKETQPVINPTKVYYTNGTIGPNNITNNIHSRKNSSISNINNPATVNTRLSTASTRKSSGSYSIYSTFGSSDSIQYGENDDGTVTSNSTIDIITEAEKNDKVDLLTIISNNLQLRSQARVINNSHLSSEDEVETEDDDEDSLSDDVFVDATGYSQDELEKEKIESRLSKRLSGGHFGSAGGLMVSIMSASDTKQRRRTSKPPPEDVAKSMLNWKRKSGQGLNAFTLPEMPEEPAEEQPPAVPEKPTRHPSPNRPLPPPPDIVFTDDDEPSAKDAAAKLWNEDESFVQRERIAEWLGQRYL